MMTKCCECIFTVGVECRRHAPKPQPINNANYRQCIADRRTFVWPRVQGGDGCGEGVARTEATPPAA